MFKCYTIHINMNRLKLTRIWDKESQSYSQAAETQPDYVAHYLFLKQMLGDVRGKTVCDVGSGTAITSSIFANEGASVTLIDISPEALKFGKSVFKKKKLPVHVVEGDLFKINLPAKSFDVVWNGGVIEHFSDDEKVEMIRRMWKWVKPGGKILISVPNADDLVFMAAKWLLIKRGRWTFGYEDDLTFPRLEDLARRAGIDNFQIKTYNPIVGWWFLPWGREITNILGLNTVNWHVRENRWGHNLVFVAQK